MDSGFNAVEEYFEIRKLFAEMIQVICISQLYQLSKKYPDIYENIRTSEHDIYNIFMTRNLSKGIKEGYFNGDIEVNDCIFLSEYKILYNKRYNFQTKKVSAGVFCNDISSKCFVY